ncbi:hypothetical protein MUGA111182_20500 [Mucilaginibacter galii]
MPDQKDIPPVEKPVNEDIIVKQQWLNSKCHRVITRNLVCTSLCHVQFEQDLSLSFEMT